MKAILIIDVDENADFENAIADITFRDNQWGFTPTGIKHWYNGIKLKPLPIKRDKHKGKIVVKSEEEATNMQILINQCCDIGFNACLDEILGEEE